MGTTNVTALNAAFAFLDRLEVDMRQPSGYLLIFLVVAMLAAAGAASTVGI
jgi:hypothetical protein